MRISMFIGQLSGGGAEKVLTMIANHLTKAGEEVEIVMLLGSAVNKEHFCLDDRIRVLDLSHKGGYLKNVCKWFLGIRHYLKSSHPDLIISFIGRINALVLTSSIGLHIPVIVSERNDPHNDGRGFFMYHYCNMIYRKASAIVFQSQYQQNSFSKSLLCRGHIIHNPVKKHTPINEEYDVMQIATAGRLQPSKNHNMLIQAMAIVVKKVPLAECTIYGEGPLKDSLQTTINNLNLSKSIVLAGQKTNIVDYLSKCNVFVMTSEYEGLSNSLIEAMMLGKVCITTDYPGVEELIEDGKTGFIVPRGDATALANAIESILSNKDEVYYNEIRNAAKKKVESYDEPIILSKWDNLISCVMNG